MRTDNDNEHQTMPVTWKVTRDIRPDDLHCDLCGAPADTLHFVPYIQPCEQVVFACPDHCPSPQGYMVDIARWFAEPDKWIEHIGRKFNGEGYDAIAVLGDRFSEMQRELAKEVER